MSSKLKNRGASLHDLADEEVEEILIKLPPFDLGRCKAVCRRFRSLISSPLFVSAHLNRSKSDPSSHRLLLHNISFMYLCRRKPGPSKSVITLTSETLCIVGSVNGLICLARRSLDGESRRNIQYPMPMSPDDIWILNPVTRLCRKLPSPSPESCITPDTVTVKSAFWCEGDGVYKVAKIVSDPDGTTVLEVWVSSSPDTWTTLGAYSFQFESSPYTWAHPCNVIIDGLAAYWIVYNRRRKIFVMSLDFKTMRLKWIPFNKQLMRSELALIWGNLNGEFVLLLQQKPRSRQNPPSYGDCMYVVWKMVVNGNADFVGWKKSFRIYFDFPFKKCLGPVNGKLVFETYNNIIITLFDLEITQTKQVLEEDPELFGLDTLSAHGFVGSLVSIEGFGFEYCDHLSYFIMFQWPSSYPSGKNIEATEEEYSSSE